ncbi:cupin domain-containing protein [Anaerocolumna xylanovorans]|uniref:Cupin domain protein n=1 Tax=Anaerocolumna xylanovorans DSM 12503 TaxID=1121345 RepID=A0A1M7XZC1_9FIRM|nr:cupin domain-containing protein [Anaerocolumna xylanovorans]SHO44293.1 Cupin domain protein [Anaerocolumna xylanovorans DSM 12503]
MSAQYLKNINFEQTLKLMDLVEYQPGQVVSRTLVQNDHVGITLFSFDKGELISTHASTGDALINVLTGKARITIGGKDYTLAEGESIVMPNNVPHAVYAEEKFKMLLTVVFPY